MPKSDTIPTLRKDRKGTMPRTSGLNEFDPMAASFFLRAGITNSTQQQAVNNLVLALRPIGISKFVAVYPYVGGTASSHSHNLISSSFQISWSGGVTHNANGITGNGTTGFGDTGLKPSDTGANGGISVYMRVLPSGDSNKAAGVDNGVDVYDLVFDVTSNGKYGRYGANQQALQSTAVATGFYSLSRLSNTDLRLDRNGSSIATNNVNSAVTPISTLNFLVLAGNGNGLASFFSEENDALTSFHQGLTQSESASFYTAVQAFQTTLGRQV